jgi:hypothetical protein
MVDLSRSLYAIALTKVEALQQRVKELEERLSEQIEDNGRIHDEKMKFWHEADSLRADNQRMIAIAGEALSTQPEQRGPDTVEVLANHSKRLSEEIVRLREALSRIADWPEGAQADIAKVALDTFRSNKPKEDTK